MIGNDTLQQYYDLLVGYFAESNAIEGKPRRTTSDQQSQILRAVKEAARMSDGQKAKVLKATRAAVAMNVETRAMVNYDQATDTENIGR